MLDGNRLGDLLVFAQRSEVSFNAARMWLSWVSKFLLVNAGPQRASGCMSMLPSVVTYMFSNDETRIHNKPGDCFSKWSYRSISRECSNDDILFYFKAI